MQHLARVFVICAALAVHPGGYAAESLVRITDLRHSLYQERMRLVFELSEEISFDAFHLSDPDRLVFRCTPGLPGDVPTGAELDLPYIAGVRHGLFRPDRGRVVLDLERPLRIERIHVAESREGVPARLVVDLSPVPRAAFDQVSGWPDDGRRTGQRAPANPAKETFIVAIDPGHGGIDPGAEFGGLVEKRVVLEFARRLAAQLSETPDMGAFLTRADDRFVPLAERVALAHQADADIMISVHADVLEEGRASGISLYTLSERATDQAAKALAERENRSDVLAGTDLEGESDALAQFLIELAQRGTTPESERLAETLLGAFGPDFKLLRTRPHRQGNFRVLKAPDIPSVLLELGFMNSAADRVRLSSPDWQERVARRVVEGIQLWRTWSDTDSAALR